MIRILQRYGMTGSFVREWSTVLSIAADGVCELEATGDEEKQKQYPHTKS